jgi:ATP-dependent DNA ligase
MLGGARCSVMALPLQPPFRPMLAKLARTIPEGDGWLFEPKWDGFRCVVFRDGDEIELASRNERPFTRYFPELIEPLKASLPLRSVVDGEIVVADRDGNGLDFDALLQRIHPAESRVRRLAAETPASFVAFDLLALDDESLLDRPLFERRAELLRVLRPAPPVHLTPASTDPATAAEWFGRFEGAGLDGVVAKRLDEPYQPDKRALVKVKHERTADCVVAGYRIHKDGNGVGSLLLGLYDDQDRLQHVGVAASFPVKFRAELLAELEPMTHGAVDDHPWRDWAEWQHTDEARKPGATSRWNAGKDLSWVPIRVERVAEVTFGQLEKGRFRHGVSFVRWRPDRTPESCRYAQLDVAEKVPFEELVSPS